MPAALQPGRDPAKPVCNTSTGLCAPDGGAGEGEGEGEGAPEVDSGTGGQPVGPGPGSSPGAPNADSTGCECRATPGSGSAARAAWLLPLLWFAARRRR